MFQARRQRGNRWSGSARSPTKVWGLKEPGRWLLCRVRVRSAGRCGRNQASSHSGHTGGWRADFQSPTRRRPYLPCALPPKPHPFPVTRPFQSEERFINHLRTGFHFDFPQLAHRKILQPFPEPSIVSAGAARSMAIGRHAGTAMPGLEPRWMSQCSGGSVLAEGDSRAGCTRERADDSCGARWAWWARNGPVI